jgi:cytochrome b pre-mRNA-processing protein 3
MLSIPVTGFGECVVVMVWLIGKNKHHAAEHAAYFRLVAQAREAVFYASHGVPDSLDGRFEMIALHLFLVLHRLKREAGTEEFRQGLFDLMFQDMDRGLREMGTGDLGVGRQVKLMAQAFYGRIAAYEPGVDGDPAALEEGLRRNLFGTVKPDPADLAFMASYIRRQVRLLATQRTADIVAGILSFEPASAVPDVA